MTEIKKGTQFFVCARDILEEKGWVESYGDYRHDDFPDNTITGDMMDENEWEILTVEEPTWMQKDWYTVEENEFDWPVATFLNPDVFHQMALSAYNMSKAHICEEGMTPIGNWFICKHCGNDLRSIR